MTVLLIVFEVLIFRSTKHVYYIYILTVHRIVNLYIFNQMGTFFYKILIIEMRITKRGAIKS
jgi:hypothetical protein